jgi:hypothetical protein
VTDYGWISNQLVDHIYLHSAGVKSHDGHEDQEHAQRVHSCGQAHLPAKPLRHRHWILHHAITRCIESSPSFGAVHKDMES